MKSLAICTTVLIAVCLLAYVEFHVPSWVAILFISVACAYGAEVVVDIVPGSVKLILTDSHLIETHFYLTNEKLKLDESILTCSDPPDADDVLYYLTKKKKTICLDVDTFEDMDSLRAILLAEVPFVPPDEYDQYVRLHWR